MPCTAKYFLILGGLNAALVVLLGAFGAHGLKSLLSAEMLVIFETGVRYHLFHALGLLAVGLSSARLPESALLKWSGWLMLLGIILFSGSLYFLSVSGIRGIGIVTPVGGVAFILAWLLYAAAFLKIQGQPTDPPKIS